MRILKVNPELISILKRLQHFNKHSQALSSGPHEWVQGGVWGLNLLALEFGFRLEAKRLGAEAMRFGTTAMLLSH